MQSFRSIVLAGAVAVLASGSGYAATYTIVAHVPAEQGIIDGELAADAAGRLFGTQGSGLSGGRIFVLTPTGTQGMRFKDHTAFSFAPYVGAGLWDPIGGVTFSQSGLIGPLGAGGIDCGGVFRLDSRTNPTLNILHEFGGVHVSPPDASCPQSGLTVGLGGYLYGTTFQSNKVPAAVYAISGSSSAPAYEIIYRFNQPGNAGEPTNGRLAVDTQERLYGALTTGDTLASGGGEVFAIQRAFGRWKEKVIHLFPPIGTLGQLLTPIGNVTVDLQGNVYGCADYGIYGAGGIYRLAPPVSSAGTWSYSVLYSFDQARLDPSTGIGCGITVDPATGIIYGTTEGGGTHAYGTIFSLTPPPPGQTQWTETIIHSFDNSYFDGAFPVAPPLKVGNTYYGGTTTGSVYAFQP